MSERTQQARAIVRQYTYWSAGLGLIPVPAFDMVAIWAAQTKMVADLSKHYEIQFSEDRIRALITSLVGGVVPVWLAGTGVGSWVKSVPFIGTVLGVALVPAFAAATAQAVGNVFLNHYEAGGTLLDFNPDKMREYFRAEFEVAKTEHGATDDPEDRPAEQAA